MGQSGSSRSTAPSSPTATTTPSRPRSKTTQTRPQHVDVTGRIKQDVTLPSSPVFGSPLDDDHFFFNKGSPHNESVDLTGEMEDKDKLPTVFRWTEGGTNVYVAGTFTNWKKIPLVKSHNNFVTILDIPEGEHQYKFFIDGNWCHDENQSVTPDPYGGVNNVLIVQKGDCDLESIEADSGRASGSPTGSYTSEIPATPQGSQAAPPVLPPHLHYVLLNQDPPLQGEPTILPEPNHVSLNHLYALSIKDGVLVLGVTHRYKKKYVTTLLYRPL